MLYWKGRSGAGCSTGAGAMGAKVGGGTGAATGTMAGATGAAPERRGSRWVARLLLQGCSQDRLSQLARSAGEPRTRGPGALVEEADRGGLGRGGTGGQLQGAPGGRVAQISVLPRVAARTRSCQRRPAVMPQARDSSPSLPSIAGRPRSAPQECAPEQCRAGGGVAAQGTCRCCPRDC